MSYNIPPIPTRSAEDDTAELNQLREEMRRFKEALETQKIISERLLRNAINQRSSRIMLFVKIEAFVLLPLTALSFLPLCLFFGVSWLLYFVTLFMILCSVVIDYIINRPLDPVNSSLIDILEHLIKQKKQRIRELLISIPVIILWFLWYVFSLPTFDDGYALIGCAIIGLIVGGCIAAVVFIRQQQSINDSIREINLITRDDPSPLSK